MSKYANGIIKIYTIVRIGSLSNIYLTKVLGLEGGILGDKFSKTKQDAMEEAQYWHVNTGWPIKYHGVL